MAYGNNETRSTANEEFSVRPFAEVKWRIAHIGNKNIFTLKINELERGRCIYSIS
jgi:hypothetical protein